MRDYIEQFYNEGLATTFYLKPVTWIRKKINNKLLLEFLVILIKVLYTVFVLILAFYMFLDRYPL